ncbi:MAG: DsrE family protein [Gammaproteobacteria bacterium]|nr:DsrE family protein [Gammaproteobacteria bacterium]MCK5262443.1 DsrE family protein [Gammaproteobacteria bacterium]
MSKKLLIILANSDPANAAEVGAPLFQATVAAAMGHDVEIVITGNVGLLASEGHAVKLEINHDTHRTIYDVIKEAHKAGVIFKVCAPSVQIYGDDLISEIDESVGSAYVVSEAMDDDTVTFTY